MKTALEWALGLCLSTTVTAHDFWVQPAHYWLKPAAADPVTLQVGHGPLRRRSPIPLNRIVRFAAIGPDGTETDLRNRLTPGAAGQDGEIAFREAGSYVLVLETDSRAESHLPAIRFNDYLEAEGLAPALAQRELTHRMDADGAESYSRRAKTLIQVGNPAGGSGSQVTKPIGLPLEIVPEVNPYSEPRAGSLPVRVIYAGQPLEGALIKLTRLEDDARPLETHRTDHAGRATFALPGRGTWLLNVIWTRALPQCRETDFETVFSSLSFGFP